MYRLSLSEKAEQQRLLDLARSIEERRAAELAAGTSTAAAEGPAETANQPPQVGVLTQPLALECLLCGASSPVPFSIPPTPSIPLPRSSRSL